MKINQSHGFANTRNKNEAVIRFAIRKLKEKGHKWEYDIYVLKPNDNSTTSGGSAGSGVYLALLSAFYSSTIPKNLAITGKLEVKKKETLNKIKPASKKYQ